MQRHSVNLNLAMVSLYVCDFPDSLEKDELSSIFNGFEGYIETRTARDRSGQKIAFVDYTDREKAQSALNQCLGYRFHGSNKGITLRISEHSKGSIGQSNQNRRVNKPQRQSPPQSMTQSFQRSPPPTSLSELLPNQSIGQIHELLAQLRETHDPALQSQIHSIENLLGQIKNEPNHLLPATLVGYNNSYQQQPVQQSYYTHHQQQQQSQQYMGQSYSSGQEMYPQPYQNNSGISAVLKGLVDNLNPEKLALENSTKSLSRVVGNLRFNIPKNATKTVYVEGLPADTTEREVAHLFRPYPGYRQLRLIPRDNKEGKRVYLCFADFETVEQTSVVVQTMQGYRFDKDDIIGLQFSFATKSGNQK